MRIINIVDNASEVNYGIWHAAIANATHLKAKGIETELWYHYPKNFAPVKNVGDVYLETTSIYTLIKLLKEKKLNNQDDIIISHGSWRFPTRWGAYLKNKGFLWIYVPQGMLEPWSLSQKRIKKIIYFHLFEKRYVSKADVIRAVSLPEKKNIESIFKWKRVELIPNAVAVPASVTKTSSPRRQYLFLSRLHTKKNVLSLAQAWLRSSLNNNEKYFLSIAGPDNGDLEMLAACIKSSRNIKYIGSIYGDAKNELMRACAFYVLPSFSEGLPSSLLEAMAFGLVPIITEGCNLPEVFNQSFALKIETDIESIAHTLEESTAWSDSKVADAAVHCNKFVNERYSLNIVVEKQVRLFNSLLKRMPLDKA